MPYVAQVYRVLIASPADVPDARNAIEDAIHAWNAAHSMAKGAVLLPWRWEGNAVPMVGDHPQAFINRQGLADADIVVAVFGARFGSPTPDSGSGTAAEIARAADEGKPVHVYFSTADIPYDVDSAQLELMRKFKTDFQNKALYKEFSTPDELQRHVDHALSHDLNQLHTSRPTNITNTGANRFKVELTREKEPRSMSPSGTMRFRTRLAVQITNRSNEDIEVINVEPVGDSGLILMPGRFPTTFQADHQRRISATFSGGGGGDATVVRVTWMEQGEEIHKDYTLE